MSTKGPGPLVWVAPVLEIGDVKYPLRRLGLMDIEALTSIVVKASRYVDRGLIGGMADMTALQVGTFVIEYLPSAFDEIVEFLATVIGLEHGYPLDAIDKKRKKPKGEFVDPNIGTIRDPNVFPLGSEVELITLLVTEHQDVLNFFDRFNALMNSGIVKKLTGPSSEPSTDSKNDTAGPTNTSQEDD